VTLALQGFRTIDTCVSCSAPLLDLGKGFETKNLFLNLYVTLLFCERDFNILKHILKVEILK